MTTRPPRLAEGLLAQVLGPSEEARSILGDLHEDFSGVVRELGQRRARRWYWRESVLLALSRLVDRILGPGTGGSRGSGHRTESRSPWGSGVLQDVRYALRAVGRDPGYLLFATLVIGLGIGATTSVFSMVKPLMLEPLPFREADRLALVENTGGGGMSSVTSRTSNLRDFRERARSFEALAGYNAFFEQESYTLVGSGEPERLSGVNVTDDFLNVLGVTPMIGRNFTEEEGRFGGPPAVILTHGFWTRRFAGGPSVVGTALTMNGETADVIGVLPPSFDFSSIFTPTVPVDILVPWPVSDETDRSGNTTTMVGRLRRGTTLDAAQEELNSIVLQLQEEDPERWGLGARVSGLQERIARPFRSGMLLLTGAAGLVMLTVCVNLSNMLLARGPRRKREMAVRRTLGATRSRLLRQLLVESVITSLGGAVVGVFLAVGATRIVAGSPGLEIPMLSSVEVDRAALLFTLSVAVLAGLAVGMLPALQIAEGGEADALGGSSRGTSSGRRTRGLRDLLVVSEVATACLLLVLGGLVLRSFRSVMHVDLGFEPENAVVWTLHPNRPFDSVDEISGFYDELVRSVLSVPGVESAGVADALPLSWNREWCARVRGEQFESDECIGFFPHVVDHRYVEAMGIPLLEGRGFSADDTDESSLVAIVNETAARNLFPRGRPIGHFINQNSAWAEVVGVVGDVRNRALDVAAANEVYFPVSQVWQYYTLEMVVRSSLPAPVIAGSVSEAIHAVAPGMATEDYRTLDSMIERSVSPRRFTLRILTSFALGALLLAGIGIYGVLSYSVTERIPEIGIRMALGESPAGVRRRLVGRILGLAAAGVVSGAVLALLCTRFVESLLYEVEPSDPLTFLLTAAVILGVAFVSGLVPAVRASRTDSAQALRSA